MLGQTSLFDFIPNTAKPYKIKNQVRLVELFSGIGSQAIALRNLGVDFTHHRAIEIDPFAVKTYNSIHNTDFKTQDICEVHGTDLGITDTDKYTYIMTYSFPCVDISLAGDKRGFSKEDHTRSGLLWEVERIMWELKELPQVLLMENVTQIHSKRHIEDFQMWLEFLESRGYQNFYQDMNAKDYGVAQNRNRTFMISLLGNYTYTFPEPIGCDKCMADYLDDVVDEKYYINNERAKRLTEQLICK